MSNAPVCTACGGTGSGVVFCLSSPRGFGNYCVPCDADHEKGKRELANAVVQVELGCHGEPAPQKCLNLRD